MFTPSFFVVTTLQSGITPSHSLLLQMAAEAINITPVTLFVVKLSVLCQRVA
jgi:hypothetical protein